MPGSCMTGFLTDTLRAALRAVQIHSRRICPTQSVTHRQTTDKQKSPMLSHEAFSFILCLAVPYSRMGRPHTTIGATAFHF